MTVKELYRKLNELIPRELSCEWDNDGDMCIPDPDTEVDTVLISLDPSKKAIKAAKTVGAQVIITHHPLIFRPIKRLSSDPCADKLTELVKSNISLFSFHTRLDALDGGVNDTLAEMIGLQNVKKFGPENEKMGRIGKLESPLSAPEFAARVRDILDAPSVSLCDCGKQIRRVALLGGDGGDFLDDAIEAGADIYLTGSIGYNKHNEARERGISILAAGHYYTEAPICGKLAKMLREIDPEINTVTFSSNEIQDI